MKAVYSFLKQRLKNQVAKKGHAKPSHIILQGNFVVLKSPKIEIGCGLFHEKIKKYH